jgi:site-specific DNA recombinase
MRNARTQQPADMLKAVRCAIYTRKSTEEGLQQEFNTLDAQRESAEAYIFSQQHEGWTCLPDRYDDGGFTGGNMDRPALQRLLADIEAGRVDAIIVYKVDRLSRSLLDFAKMLEIFDRHHVAFVSVTQQINSATSMGRLMLNVLLSFAQFEREIIGERTRDKIAATRRKGKWSGGWPQLGYDVDPRSTRLVINEEEAARVRAIFELYLQHESLLPVVQELERRGWTNKRWKTRGGKEVGGGPLDKTALHRLLINPLYSGRVKYKRERHAGEHVAIIEPAVFDRVQALLKRNRHTSDAPVRNNFEALLKGLLRCAACDCAMTPAHSTRNRTKRYRYYVCTGAQKRGWDTCPSKSVPAAELEQFVINRIRGVGQEPALLQATVAEAWRQDDERLAQLEADRRVLERDLARLRGQERDHARPLSGAPGEDALVRLAEVQEQLRQAESRLCRLKEETGALRRGRLDEADLTLALSAFDPVWGTLTPREQARVVQLLVERVDYDGGQGKVAITFQPTGIQTLADELTQRQAKGKRA